MGQSDFYMLGGEDVLVRPACQVQACRLRAAAEGSLSVPLLKTMNSGGNYQPVLLPQPTCTHCVHL